jgi:hypothetical protein
VKKKINNHLINSHGETSFILSQLYLMVLTCAALNKERIMGPDTQLFLLFSYYRILAHFVFTKLREQKKDSIKKSVLEQFLISIHGLLCACAANN